MQGLEFGFEKGYLAAIELQVKKDEQVEKESPDGAMKPSNDGVLIGKLGGLAPELPGLAHLMVEGDFDRQNIAENRLAIKKVIEYIRHQEK